MKITKFTPLVSTFFVAGCGSTPNVTVDYYLPKVGVELTVIQTAACSATDTPIMTSDIVVNPVYSADTSTTAKHSLILNNLDGAFTKGDVGFVFFDDGRLKGLNSSQAGQGGEVIKAALALKTGLGLFTAGHPECPSLKALNPKSLTIKHMLTLDFTGTPKDMIRTSIAALDFARVKGIFGDKVVVTYTLASGNGICTTRANPPGSDHCGSVPPQKGTTLLHLRTPQVATVKVVAGPTGQKFNFEFKVPVPQKGSDYTLPIPSPPLFGSTRFGLELSPSGTVTKLSYGKDTGVTGALTAITGVDSGFAAKTTSEKAAAVKAEADLIAQQQRLVRCQADPTECK